MSAGRVVVVGLDDSDLAEAAFLRGLSLARPDGAVHVVQVIGGYDPMRKLEYGAETHQLNLDAEREALRERARGIAERWAASARVAAPALEPHVLVGPVAKELVRVARAVHADFLCVGTHGRRGMGRLVLGSVAEAALREAPCSVWVVREKSW